MRFWDKCMRVADPHGAAARLIDEKLDAMRDGASVDRDELAWLSTHLGECQRCRRFSEERARLLAAFAELSAIEAPEDFAANVVARMRADRIATQTDATTRRRVSTNTTIATWFARFEPRYALGAAVATIVVVVAANVGVHERAEVREVPKSEAVARAPIAASRPDPIASREAPAPQRVEGRRHSVARAAAPPPASMAEAEGSADFSARRMEKTMAPRAMEAAGVRGKSASVETDELVDATLVVRAIGSGAAKARAHAIDVVKRYGGTFFEREGASYARVPREHLVEIIENLVKHGPYKVTKRDDRDLEEDMKEIVIRFELD